MDLSHAQLPGLLEVLPGPFSVPGGLQAVLVTPGPRQRDRPVLKPTVEICTKQWSGPNIPGTDGCPREGVRLQRGPATCYYTLTYRGSAAAVSGPPFQDPAPAALGAIYNQAIGQVEVEGSPRQLEASIVMGVLCEHGAFDTCSLQSGQGLPSTGWARSEIGLAAGTTDKPSRVSHSADTATWRCSVPATVFRRNPVTNKYTAEQRLP